jgi:hypothetical protein
MAKTSREARIIVRVSQPLQDELTAAAQEEGRTLAGFVRRYLVDLAAQRMTEKEHR